MVRCPCTLWSVFYAMFVQFLFNFLTYAMFTLTCFFVLCPQYSSYSILKFSRLKFQKAPQTDSFRNDDGPVLAWKLLSVGLQCGRGKMETFGNDDVWVLSVMTSSPDLSFSYQAILSRKKTGYQRWQVCTTYSKCCRRSLFKQSVMGLPTAKKTVCVLFIWAIKCPRFMWYGLKCPSRRRVCFGSSC